jgi:hypothetical protein
VSEIRVSDVRTDDLRDLAVTRELFRRARRCGRLGKGEAEVFRFLTVRAWALRVGKSPAALFWWGLGQVGLELACMDEDKARALLKPFRERKPSEPVHISEILPSSYLPRTPT